MKTAVSLLVLIMAVTWATVPVPAAQSAAKKSSAKTKGGFSGATPKPASSSAQTANPFVTPAPAKSSTATGKARATPSAKKSSGKAAAKPRQKVVASESDAPAGGENSAARSEETKSKKSPKAGTAGATKPKESAAATDDAPKVRSDPAPEPAGAAKVPDDSEKSLPQRNDGRAPNATLSSEELVGFAAQPARVQQLIEAALALTRRQLTYDYGSADPSSGGMDCSGTIYYLLRMHGFKDVPRDSPGQYAWARKSGGFRAVVSNSEKSFEFDEMLPGDLMFWSGTYSVKREMPVTHVMLYLGTEKKGRKRVMFGASDGRTYDAVQRWGVSVFDFKMPRTDAEKPRTDFLGYARIPGIRHEPSTQVAASESKPAAASNGEATAASSPADEGPAGKPEIKTSGTASAKPKSPKKTLSKKKARSR